MYGFWKVSVRSHRHEWKLGLKGSNMISKSVQNGPKIGRNRFKMDPWRPLGASWPSGGLLERSWKASGLKKRTLEWPLAAPRGIPREIGGQINCS